MKKVFFLGLWLLLFSSCSSTIKTVDTKSLFEVLTQQSDGGANIRFFEILSEPKEIALLQTDEKLKNKIHPNDSQNCNFVVLNMGEKKSSGYKIGVESAVETDKNIIITVKETTPDPDAITLQVITYPYCIVKINSKKEIIFK